MVTTIGGEGMNIWHKSYESHPVFIGSASFLCMLIGMQFVFDNTGAMFLNPALAIGFVFVYIHGRYSYLPLFWGVLIAQVFMRTFIWQEPIVETMLIAVLLPLIFIIQIEIGIRLAGKLKLEHLFKQFYPLLIGKLFVQTTSLALVGGGLGFLLFTVTGVIESQFLGNFVVIFLGDWFALALFVPTGLLGYRYDPDWLKLDGWKNVFKYLSLVFVFFLFAFLLVFEVGYLRFENDYYVFLLLFLLLGFVSAYRLMHYFILILLMFGVWHVNQFETAEQFRILLNLYIFTVFGLVLTLLIKRFNDDKNAQNKQIHVNNIAVDRLLDDVYDLLQFSNKMITEMHPEERETYLVRTLKIAMRLFDDCDAGYCYVDEVGTLRFLHAENYDINALPYVYESHDIMTQVRDDLHVLQNIEETFKVHYGETFNILNRMKSSVSSRAMIRFELNKDLSFYIVIDKGKSRDIFSEQQLDRLEQFVQLLRSLFVRNYLTVQNMELKNEIVLSIVRTLEIYDPYTKGHSEDVAFLVTSIAEKLEVKKNQMRNLYWAGILHDIGKVGIENQVLNKPGKLTDAEYAKVKEHADYGYDILARQKDLQPIAVMIKHHHEWWDGRGYPDGIKEHAIPLGSQIISVADMIATMATNRTYRKRQAKVRIINELKLYRGTQFSPKVVDAALELLEADILEKHYRQTF